MEDAGRSGTGGCGVQGCLVVAVAVFAILLVGMLIVAVIRFSQPPQPRFGAADAATGGVATVAVATRS